MKCIIYINFTCFFSLFHVATRKFESTEVAGICDSHDVSLADTVLKLPPPAPGRGSWGSSTLALTSVRSPSLLFLRGQFNSGQGRASFGLSFLLPPLRVAWPEAFLGKRIIFPKFMENTVI